MKWTEYLALTSKVFELVLKIKKMVDEKKADDGKISVDEGIEITKVATEEIGKMIEPYVRE